MRRRVGRNSSVPRIHRTTAETQIAPSRILTPVNHRIVESVYRRLLAEAYDYSGLAAYVESKAKSASITLYDASAVEDLKAAAVLLKAEDAERAGEFLHSSGVVKGYIKIAAPMKPCNDAWQVKFSAGPGYGKFLYGAAFEVSPSGFIMPDRGQVSTSAAAGWSSAAQKSREVLPLDNYKKPKTKPKSDDCKVYGDEVLDAAYSAEGWEFGFMRSARREHTSTVEFMEDMGVMPKRFELALVLAGVLVFRANYDPGAVAAVGEG